MLNSESTNILEEEEEEEVKSKIKYRRFRVRGE